MIRTSKCFEYYLDSKICGSQEIQESIDETKKEFPKKNIEAYVSINDYGMYVITFYFQNKSNYFSRLKIRFKSKKKTLLLLEDSNKNELIKEKVQKVKTKKTKSKAKTSRLEKYYGENKYGQYESKGIYRPY